MLPWKLPRGRVLVLAAHPDDETLGCGGALALHRRQRDPVKVVFITDGGAGDPEGHYRARDYCALRRREARGAARLLGLSDLEFWGLADGRLVAERGLAERLRALLERERPDIVYRPAARDPHPDHAALARAFEKAAGRSPSFIDCRYEVCWLQRPNAVVDISGVYAKKARALAQYRSQLRYQDYQKVSDRTSVLRSLYLAGAKHAEAFRR